MPELVGYMCLYLFIFSWTFLRAFMQVCPVLGTEAIVAEKFLWGCGWGRGREGGTPPPPPPGRPAYAQPLSPWRQVPASMAFVTDSNRPQPLWQPPPTACPTASGAASEAPSLLMHPWGGL